MVVVLVFLCLVGLTVALTAVSWSGTLCALTRADLHGAASTAQRGGAIGVTSEPE
jgi:hypothetical protein